MRPLLRARSLASVGALLACACQGAEPFTLNGPDCEGDFLIDGRSDFASVRGGEPPTATRVQRQVSEIRACGGIAGRLVIEGLRGEQPEAVRVDLPYLRGVDELRLEPTHEARLAVNLHQLRYVGTLDLGVLGELAFRAPYLDFVETLRVTSGRLHDDLDVSRLSYLHALHVVGDVEGPLRVALPELDEYGWLSTFRCDGRIDLDLDAPTEDVFEAIELRQGCRVWGLEPSQVRLLRIEGWEDDRPQAFPSVLHAESIELDTPNPVVLPELRTLERLRLRGRAALRAPRLRDVGGIEVGPSATGPDWAGTDVELPALEHLERLDVADVTGGRVSLGVVSLRGGASVVGLGELDLPRLTSSLADLHIQGVGIASLPRLARVEGDLTLGAARIESPELETVAGAVHVRATGSLSLPALRSAQTLSIRDTNGLVTVEAPRLELLTASPNEGGELRVVGNHDLRTLDLPALRYVARRTVIVDNPVLAPCFAERILLALATQGSPGEVMAYDNEGTTPCP